MTWQPNLSSHHALAISETDDILKIFKRRVTILVLSLGAVGGLCQQQRQLRRHCPEDIRCFVSFNTPWIRLGLGNSLSPLAMC